MPWQGCKLRTKSTCPAIAEPPATCVDGQWCTHVWSTDTPSAAERESRISRCEDACSRKKDPVTVWGHTADTHGGWGPQEALMSARTFGVEECQQWCEANAQCVAFTLRAQTCTLHQSATSRSAAGSVFYKRRALQYQASWTNFEARGFSVDVTTGRCVCEAGPSSSCTQHTGNNVWRYDLAPTTRSTRQFRGTCKKARRIPMYSAITSTVGDAVGETQARLRVVACQDACLTRMVPQGIHASDWNGYNLRGFVVNEQTGECACENTASDEAHPGRLLLPFLFSLRHSPQLHRALRQCLSWRCSFDASIPGLLL